MALQRIVTENGPANWDCQIIDTKHKYNFKHTGYPSRRLVLRAAKKKYRQFKRDLRWAERWDA